MLAQIAERLRNEIRSVDIGCRVGGDEFGVIMPESTAEDARSCSSACTTRWARCPCPEGSACASRRGSRSFVTARPHAGLFERADSALYRAKELGKDRANVATD